MFIDIVKYKESYCGYKTTNIRVCYLVRARAMARVVRARASHLWLTQNFTYVTVMKTTQNIDILYDSDEQVLSEADANNCIEHYWTDIYQKHHNDINEVWNDLSRRAYQNLIEEETQEEDSVTHDLTKFLIILREHFDSIIPIERKITPMKNPKITTQELKSHLKSIKSRKATGPDDLKGELYEAFAQSDACTTVLKASFQDILEKTIKKYLPGRSPRRRWYRKQRNQLFKNLDQ